jgi:hypothetical protein
MEALLNASKEVDLEVNSEKTKYRFMSHHHNTSPNNNIKTANKSLKNVS